MDRLSRPKQKALGMGMVGLILIVLGAKSLVRNASVEPEFVLPSGQASLIFFNLDESCECMQDLVRQADDQVNQWQAAARSHVPVYRFDIDQYPQLAEEYQVFRVPALLLVDKNGKVAYRQDYQLIEGGPLKLPQFEVEIRNLLEAET